METSLKKEFKEILIEQRKEYERHIGALREDFGDQTKMISESLSGTNKKLDSVVEMVAKNTEDIDVMKGSINLIQSDIKELKKDVGVLKEDMSVVKSDISTIKFDLKNKVDLDEFKTLEKRVLFLERKTSHA
jgi:chromosome segregation ATPase